MHSWRTPLAIHILLVCETWLNLNFAVWFQYSLCIIRMFFSCQFFARPILINHIVCCQIFFGIIDKAYKYILSFFRSIFVRIAYNIVSLLYLDCS